MNTIDSQNSVKMFVFRERKTNAAVRQLRPMTEIAATHEDLPLKEVNWAERWCTLTKDFEYVFEQIFNFEVRDDDVFVVTFMKCGTTWMQETAWLLMNELNFEQAKNMPLLTRSKYLEFSGIFHEVPNTIKACDLQQSPRLIKSHLPVNLLPKQLWQKKQKVIYVARNVKDVVVSSYHFVKDMGIWSGNMDEYVHDFMNNELFYTPCLPHLVDFWKLRHEPHICFITYEQMKHDMAGVIAKLCTFLERPQLTKQELQETLEHLSFNKMKDNKQTNLTQLIKDVAPTNVNEKFQFMRRGIIGSYKDELTEEHQRILDEWSSAFFAQHGIEEQDIFGTF